MAHSPVSSACLDHLKENQTKTASDPPGPILSKFVWFRQWDKVMDRLLTHPQDVAYVARTGSTALHGACEVGAPKEVIEALAGAYVKHIPDIISRGMQSPLHVACGSDTLNGPSADVVTVLLRAFGEIGASKARCPRSGRTALHEACVGSGHLLHRGTLLGGPDSVKEMLRNRVNCIRALLEANPDIARISDENGSTPLLCAVVTPPPGMQAPVDSKTALELMKERYEVVELLLKANPKAASTANWRGSTPIQVLWDSLSNYDIGVLSSISCVEELMSYGVIDDASCNADDLKMKRLLFFWKTLQLLVVCASTSHGEKKRKTNTVQPENSCGRKFLHDIVRLSSKLNQQLLTVAMHLHRNEAVEVDSECERRTPLATACASTSLTGVRASFVVAELLKINPRAAAIPDANGALPLSLAIRSGKSWENGLQALVSAEPQTLSTRDIASHMYPFMLAAQDPVAATTHGSGLSTVYQLLASCPEVVLL